MKIAKTAFVKFLFVFTIFIFPVASHGQTTKPPAQLSDQAEIMLLTIYPGSELYSVFGHTAIRIVDNAYQLDRIYNYGTFSFDEPGFYIKFCRGQLDYILSAYPYRYAHQMYMDEQRPIIAQVLNLTPAMKSALYEFLEWNYRPENRRYRYDFFFDNCATRIRDIFENTLKDKVNLYYNNERKWTFRNYIDIYLVNHPFSDYGIDLSLGAQTDRIATGREAMFLPDYLFESVANATVIIDSVQQPFVARTDTLFWVDGIQNPPKKSTFPWASILLWPVFLLACFFTWQGWRHQNKSAAATWFDRILFIFAGVVGILVIFLWFFTDHKVTPDNWNLAWAWPTHLIIAFLIFSKKSRAWLKPYLFGYAGLLFLFALSWLWLPQALHSATLALVLSLALRSTWLAYDRRENALQ